MAAAEGAEAPAAIRRTGEVTLGTSGIRNPDPPADRDAAWSGNFVTFGEYDGKPIRFRVLQKDSTAYTETPALFLDSDALLFESVFDEGKPYSNSWSGSSLQKLLNGEFLAGFDAREQAAVALSTGNGGISWPGDLPKDSWWGVPVSIHDRVFLLDHAEVRNEAYGYTADSGFHKVEGKSGSYGHPVPNRKKTGEVRSRCWVLRTASAENSENRGWHVVSVLYDGSFYTETAADAGVYSGSGTIGVAPALNVDQRQILLAEKTGENEYKLTLIEEELTAAVPEGQAVSLAGRTVTVPCEIGGAAAGETTRASVLILDKAWTAGNENGAGILYYGLLDGSFDLPEGLDPAGWGKDWFVYLLAENRRGAQETDDASAPAALEAPGKVSRSYWKMYWKPGEYAIQLTPEEEGLLSGIIQEADRRSAGTMARYGAEHESDLEMMAEGFLQLSPDGTPIEDKRNEYDDIGYYRWAPGLPDEGSVRMETAWKAALKCLLDQGLATPETLVSYYPMFSYEMGNDPENPVWRFIPVCCDASQPQLPRMPWEITVYAHDGSICGYRDYQPES